MTSERFDHAKIEQGVRLLLDGMGEDSERAGLRETPSRVARMYQEIFAGIDVDAANVVTVVEG
ncbi:MAG TPA: GTP cyclohydrolase I, partial [Actinomycetota bacterium]